MIGNGSGRFDLRRALAVATLSAASCLAYSDRALLALLAPAIKTAFGSSDAVIGLLLGPAFVVPYILGSLAFATVADRVRPARTVLGSLTAWTLATVACGLAPSLIWLALGRLAVGLGQAPFAAAALALLAGDREGRVGRSTAYFTAGATLGRSAALLGGGAAMAWVGVPLLGPAEGWRAVFVLAAVPGLAILGPLLLLRDPAAPPVPPRRAGLRWIVAHRRAFLAHTGAAGSAVLVIQTLTAWAPSILTRQHGLDIAGAGGAFGVIVLACAPLGHLCGGVLLDALTRRIGPRAPGLMILGSLVAAFPLLALFGLAQRLDLALIGLAGATLTLGLASPPGLAGVRLMAPPEVRAGVTAVFLACVSAIGFGLGPPVLGALTDLVFGAGGLGQALVTLAACAIAGATTALLIRDRGREHR